MVSILGTDWILHDIDGIIFDKDGTLTDLHLYWGRIVELRAVILAKNFNLPIPELCHIMGYDVKTRKLLPEGPVGLVSRNKVIEITSNKCKELWGIYISPMAIGILFDRAHQQFQEEMFDYVKLFPGAEFLLDTLYQKHIKLALLTSDSVFSTEAILDYLQIRKYFDIVAGRETFKESKDTGIPCAQIVNELSLYSQNVVTIGDTPIDITMGQKCGCLAGIGVTTGQTDGATFKNYTSFITDTLSHLTIGVK